MALDNANLHSLIADGDDPDEVGVEILMDDLGLDEDDAIDLWARFQAAQNNDRISDDEFDRMSDEELIEYIEKTRDELREMVGWSRAV